MNLPNMPFEATAKLTRYVTQEELDEMTFGLTVEEFYTKFFKDSFVLPSVTVEYDQQGRLCVWYDCWAFRAEWFELNGGSYSLKDTGEDWDAMCEHFNKEPLFLAE